VPLGKRDHVEMEGRSSTSRHYHVTSQARIIAAVKNIDASMLTRVCQEIEYRIDVYLVTRGAHIELL
jgi:hypothetical protein